MNLRLDWCSHEAAKFACENWHYSQSLPIGRLVKVGVWEDGLFVGCVIFSHGTAKDLGTIYGLTQFECCELTRVALKKHRSSVTRIVAISLKMLKKQSPGVKLVVSFADGERGHIGSIYQAGNWVYTGNVAQKHVFILNGKEIPSRSYFEMYKIDRSIKKKIVFKHRLPKYRYLMPLVQDMVSKVEGLRKPPPKRAGSKDNVVAGFHSAEGGVTPTPALQRSLVGED